MVQIIRNIMEDLLNQYRGFTCTVSFQEDTIYTETAQYPSNTSQDLASLV
jgi:hypothetical protein